jgi:environmental stress-induced protein Ves
MLHLLRASDYREAPWKNGGGLSYEIAADDFTPPTWRISVARIDRDGPFSDFRGYDRTIVALDGGTVTLEVPGGSFTLERGQPFPFAGEIPVTARLTGEPARDLNVMTLRNEWLHDVEIVNVPMRFVLDEDEFAFVYAHSGATLVDNERCTAGDTMVVDEAESFSVLPDFEASAVVIRVTPTSE